MLVLTRKPGEQIVIAGNIRVTVVSLGQGRVKIGVEAPSDVTIDRQEIFEKRLSEQLPTMTTDSGRKRAAMSATGSARSQSISLSFSPLGTGMFRAFPPPRSPAPPLYGQRPCSWIETVITSR